MLSENNMRTNLYLKWTTHTLLSVGTILARIIQSAVGYFLTVIYYTGCPNKKYTSLKPKISVPRSDQSVRLASFVRSVLNLDFDT